MLQTKSIIDDRDTLGPGTLTARSPATGEALAEVSLLDEAGVGAAVAAAQRAAPAWAATPVAERQRLLARLLVLLVDEEAALAELIARENGKPMAEARLIDLLPGCAAVAHLARRAHRLLAFRPETPVLPLLAHRRAGFRFEPLGVVAIITPWNYPAGIPLIQIAAALAAGNTVVFKPASATVLIGLALGQLTRRAGFPPGVVNTVALAGRHTDALVDHPAVAKVLFTGSVEIGRRVAQRVAARLGSVQLELGGKDAAVVAADADLETTARGLVWGAFMNTGQTCASIERAYIVEPLFEPLVRRIVQLTGEIEVGDPLAPGTDLGPMTTAEQRELVHRHVSEAVAGGARALMGGVLPAGAGLYYPPTVLVDVSEGMAVMRDETFGPVLPIAPVASLEEGITRANASRFCLTASGWTRSRATARRLEAELRAGVVTINDHVVAFGEPTGAWGGAGESGAGRSHGELGLREVCHVKYVLSELGRPREAAWYYPYDVDFSVFVRAILPALYAQGRQKLSALLTLARTRRFAARVRKAALLRHARTLL